MSIITLCPVEKDDSEKKKLYSKNVSLQQLYKDILVRDFSRHGRAVVKALRKEKPEQYLRIIAQIFIKKEKNEEEINNGDQLTDEQLYEIIRSLEKELHSITASKTKDVHLTTVEKTASFSTS
ncbi:MAG: hypothetical protein EU981_02535 [Candidatus Liberibacter ctenarytainae]|uniref:Uncharacterized protein n=1 Tax=Candidatus Liberibacter ctenarytainae TaxID=2020335 RepID=A0A937AK66_9HYPH|nr:hypothetical protein [Candidatus Liberibacter ctenarytainae]